MIALIVIAALSNAAMDLSADGKLSEGLNKVFTSGDKWKNGDKAQGEAFLMSSTVLVMFTDFWHFIQFIFHSSWQIITVLALDLSWWWFFIIKAGFSLIFEITYRYGEK